MCSLAGDEADDAADRRGQVHRGCARRARPRTLSWLAGLRASTETAAATYAGGRAVVELLEHLPHDGQELAWPVAVVAESPDDLSVVFRTSAWLGRDMAERLCVRTRTWRGGGLSHYSSIRKTGHLLAGMGIGARGLPAYRSPPRPAGRTPRGDAGGGRPSGVIRLRRFSLAARWSRRWVRRRRPVRRFWRRFRCRTSGPTGRR